MEDIKRYLFTIGYCIIYILCYVLFLNRYCEYAGFTLYNTDIDFIVISVLIAAFPIHFHKGYKAISSFITIFIYILLYVPIILTFGLGYNILESQIVGIQIIFMFCMILLFRADRFTMKSNISIRFSNHKDVTSLIFKTALIITVILTLYILYLYRGNLRFVAFEKIYELRTANQKYGEGLIDGYLSSWLSVLLIPVCLTYGLIYKKKLYFIVACFASLIIYMSTGAKGIFLFPVFFIVCYLFLRRASVKKMYSKFVFLFATALLILLLFPAFSDKVHFAKSMTMWRIVGNGGYLTMWYHNYFSTNPYTYYSHINIVNIVTEAYPYDVPLGVVIGQAYWGSMNANANFWATDGIAACGMSGVILITFLLFSVLVFFNTITKKINTLFVLLLTIPFSYSILNVSLFTSLLSGGGFLMMLLFIILSSNSNITTNENANHSARPQFVKADKTSVNTIKSTN